MSDLRQIIEPSRSGHAWLECRTVEDERPEEVRPIPDGWEAEQDWEPIGCGTNRHRGGYLVTVTVWKREIRRVDHA